MEKGYSSIKRGESIHPQPNLVQDYGPLGTRLKTPELYWLALFIILDMLSTFDGFVTHYVFGYWQYDLIPIINLLVDWWAPSLVLYFIILFGLCITINKIIKSRYPQYHTYFRGMLMCLMILEIFAVINNYIWPGAQAPLRFLFG